MEKPRYAQNPRGASQRVPRQRGASPSSAQPSKASELARVNRWAGVSSMARLVRGRPPPGGQFQRFKTTSRPSPPNRPVNLPKRWGEAAGAGRQALGASGAQKAAGQIYGLLLSGLQLLTDLCVDKRMKQLMSKNMGYTFACALPALARAALFSHP